jgi:hypothetical protein
MLQPRFALDEFILIIPRQGFFLRKPLPPWRRILAESSGFPQLHATCPPVQSPGGHSCPLTLRIPAPPLPKMILVAAGLEAPPGRKGNKS